MLIVGIGDQPAQRRAVCANLDRLKISVTVGDNLAGRSAVAQFCKRKKISRTNQRAGLPHCSAFCAEAWEARMPAERKTNLKLWIARTTQLRVPHLCAFFAKMGGERIPSQRCHPERSSWFAKRISYEVEGPRVRLQHPECFKAFRPRTPRPAFQQPPGLQGALRRKGRHPLHLPDHGFCGHLGVKCANPFQVKIQIT